MPKLTVAWTAVLLLLGALAVTWHRAGPSALLARDFFFSDQGAIGRVQALASAEASRGKQGGVKTLLKKVLDKQVSDREGVRSRMQEGSRYAKALMKGGLEVDPAAEKTILSAFANSQRSETSSLAINDKLQKQVRVAGAIKSKEQYAFKPRHAARHVHPGAAADKLRLAEAILSGRAGPTGGMIQPEQKLAALKTKKKIAAQKQQKRQSFKNEMKAKLAANTAKIEKRGLKERQSAHSKTKPEVKALQDRFAKSMMDQLRQKTKHMAASAWHNKVKAVTQQDLATASWDSSRAEEQGEEQDQGLDTTLDGKKAAAPELEVGSDADNTKISVTGGFDKDRQQLEHQMAAELNSKASQIERKDFDSIVKAHTPRKDAHPETDMVKEEAEKTAGYSRLRLEKMLEQSVKSVDHSREESLYHAGLVKEKFDGAAVLPSA